MDELKELVDSMLENYEQVKRLVRQKDEHLYEQWKAGGFLIDSNIMSMYPNIETVVERLEDEEGDEEDEGANDEDND